MGVPADIRAVPRPVNTIVDDSGRDGPKRYAVRSRASTKYVAGGNPQPKNGKVVGHIIDYKFVPIGATTAIPSTPDMLSYGYRLLLNPLHGTYLMTYLRFTILQMFLRSCQLLPSG